jgi:hypothetical protein
MPNVFGEGGASAFANFPPEDRERLAERLINKDYLDDGARQMLAITDFLIDAGRKNLNKVPPAQAGDSEPEDEPTEADSADAAPDDTAPEVAEPDDTAPDDTAAEDASPDEQEAAEDGDGQDN